MNRTIKTLKDGPSTVEPLAYNLRLGVTGKRNYASDKEKALRDAVHSVVSQVDQSLREASLHPRGPAGLPLLRRHWWWERLCGALRLVWRDIPIVPMETPPKQRTRVRLTVVSSLAKGADRLVADAVL